MLRWMMLGQMLSSLVRHCFKKLSCWMIQKSKSGNAGMLSSADTVDVIAEELTRHTVKTIVLDPVRTSLFSILNPRMLFLLTKIKR
jgi:hydroxymethylpyrimidine/phosphomethylpyrimidine kinase